MQLFIKSSVVIVVVLLTGCYRYPMEMRGVPYPVNYPNNIPPPSRYPVGVPVPSMPSRSNYPANYPNNVPSHYPNRPYEYEGREKHYEYGGYEHNERHRGHQEHGRYEQNR
jgi:hypothetical protein